MAFTERLQTLKDLVEASNNIARVELVVLKILNQLCSGRISQMVARPGTTEICFEPQECVEFSRFLSRLKTKTR